MDIALVLGTIVRGIGIAEQIISVGKNAMPVIKAIKDLGDAAVAGTVTQGQLEDTEVILDLEIAEFNDPI